MASTFNLPLRRNKTMIWDGVALKRTNGVLAAIDLTAAEIRFWVRTAEGAADPPLLELSSAAPTAGVGSITIDADQVTNRGKYVLRIESTATDDATLFPVDDMRYFPFEIEVEENTGEITSLGYGSIEYAPDVP